MQKKSGLSLLSFSFCFTSKARDEHNHTEEVSSVEGLRKKLQSTAEGDAEGGFEDRFGFRFSS